MVNVKLSSSTFLVFWIELKWAKIEYVTSLSSVLKSFPLMITQRLLPQNNSGISVRTYTPDGKPIRIQIEWWLLFFYWRSKIDPNWYFQTISPRMNNTHKLYIIYNIWYIKCGWWINSRHVVGYIPKPIPDRYQFYLRHTSGQWFLGEISILDNLSDHSTLTVLRRFAICMVLYCSNIDQF